jgi:ribosomal protein S18 acetylase RimI-like enzyme
MNICDLQYRDITTEYLSEFIEFYVTMDEHTKELFYPWKNPPKKIFYNLLSRVDGKKDIRIGVFDKNKLVGQVFISTVFNVGLYGIGLHEGYQNLGLGKVLTKMCIPKLKEYNIKVMYLSAFTKNRKAISLYEKFDFIRIVNSNSMMMNLYIKRLFTLYGLRNLGFKLFLSYLLRINKINQSDESNKDDFKSIFMMRKT